MNENITKKADAIASFLTEHSCQDVEILPLDESAFTDCFVIGTVNSVGHLKGVARQLWDELIDLGLTVNNRHKSPGEDGWELIDCGSIVIHLMSPELRAFYSLEKLWKKTEESR